MNLPKLYAKVCAARPDLEVEDLKWTKNNTASFWLFEGAVMFADVAATMILAKWVEAIPETHVLANMGKMTPRDVNWLVYEMGTGGDYTDPGRDCSETPIEALAAFYLEYAK